MVLPSLAAKCCGPKAMLFGSNGRFMLLINCPLFLDEHPKMTTSVSELRRATKSLYVLMRVAVDRI
jgi:hypothetical protein